MQKRILILACLHLLIAGCDERSARDQPGIADVQEDDKEMNAAIGEARARLPEFLAALRQSGPAHTRFSVKAKYELSSGSSEHIWIGDVSYDGKSFAGRIENVPRDIKGLKYGDTVTIPSDAISDWLYVEDGRLVGAFTMRVLYGRMKPAEQQAFRQQLQYTFDW